MNLRLKPYAPLLKTFVCVLPVLAATLIGNPAMAADELDASAFEDVIETAAPDAAAETAESSLENSDEVALVEDHRVEDTGLVEMHYPIDPDLPYKERRETSAFTFGFSYENFYPEGFISEIELEDTYFFELFGETDIPMFSADLGYKYNFALGAIFAGVGYGYGTISEDRGDVTRDFTLTKMQAHLGYVMDSIFNEPYVAPYILGGTTRFTIAETAGDQSISGNTQTGFFYKVGALIQLNWMEDATARTGLIDFGLENTYIDVFMTQYTASIADDDPNLETDPNFGAGLKLEF